MKAVNLIPNDARRGRGAGSGGAAGAYAVLGALAIAVVMLAAWTLTSKQVTDREHKLANVEQQAQAVEARAAALKPYEQFAALSKARVETVNGLIGGRFDWASGLREIGRVLPSDVDIISLVGTMTPQSKTGGGGSGGGSLRGALALPAFDIVGCSPSQARVAELLVRLRTIDGVKRVALASSEKSDSASANATDCRGSDETPQFQLTVFFRATGTSATTAAGATTPAAAATTSPAAQPGTATTSAGGAK